MEFFWFFGFSVDAGFSDIPLWKSVDVLQRKEVRSIGEPKSTGYIGNLFSALPTVRIVPFVCSARAIGIVPAKNAQPKYPIKQTAPIYFIYTGTTKV